MPSAQPEKIFNDLFRAVDHLDLAAVAGLLADDVALVDELTKKWLRRKEVVLAYLAPTFAAMQSIRYTLYDLHVSVGTDVATVTCMLDQTYVLDGKSTTIRAPTTSTLRRVNENWRIVVMQSVPFAED